MIEAVEAVKIFDVEAPKKNRCRPRCGRAKASASAGRDSFWSFDIEELDGLDRLDHDGPAVRCRCSMKS